MASFLLTFFYEKCHSERATKGLKSARCIACIYFLNNFTMIFIFGISIAHNYDAIFFVKLSMFKGQGQRSEHRSTNV